MFNFTRISCQQAETIRAEGRCNIVDIRDEASYETAHIDSALHLGNHNLQQFIDEADPNLPLLVYCYHGNSSQNAAQLLAANGFKQAYSVDGGFEAWKLLD